MKSYKEIFNESVINESSSLSKFGFTSKQISRLYSSAMRWDYAVVPNDFDWIKSKTKASVKQELQTIGKGSVFGVSFLVVGKDDQGNMRVAKGKTSEKSTWQYMIQPDGSFTELPSGTFSGITKDFVKVKEFYIGKMTASKGNGKVDEIPMESIDHLTELIKEMLIPELEKTFVEKKARITQAITDDEYDVAVKLLKEITTSGDAFFTQLDSSRKLKRRELADFTNSFNSGRGNDYAIFDAIKSKIEKTSGKRLSDASPQEMRSAAAKVIKELRNSIK